MNSFQTKNEQDIFLQHLIEKKLVKSHQPSKKGATPRDYAFKYYVLTQNDKQIICKKAFISIIGFTENSLRRLSELLRQSQTPPDKQGQHPKANTTHPEVLKAIQNHILDFPRKRTHYSGKDVEYFDARLDVKIMHALFKSKHPDFNVTYAFYANYFKNIFTV